MPTSRGEFFPEFQIGRESSRTLLHGSRSFFVVSSRVFGIREERYKNFRRKVRKEGKKEGKKKSEKIRKGRPRLGILVKKEEEKAYNHRGVLRFSTFFPLLFFFFYFVVSSKASRVPHLFLIRDYCSA